ncbi:histidine kinase sensor domain-containing protein [Lacimicrobium alkaliphilum]|uniref:histidine kinase n=1 Tax=Lacimicrobium alkaliphilum TaxID=1526571 RepID=A0ABQ1R982_9ALTE|nr:histidine kinase sensor domain-containing protein [Lacimicrobium alkaliphilum]GGD60783.1 two-component sensor histidine kinase [Lacimicrobium alkaliphilum]
MSRRLFWRLCLIIGTGVVAMFYLINLAISQIESDMSMLSDDSVAQLHHWRDTAESLTRAGKLEELENWLSALQQKEQTWAAVAAAQVRHIAGNRSRRNEYTGYNMGRSVEWQVHLYFDNNPIMELPFADGKTSLLIELPERMRPGSYWTITRITLQVLLPMLLLISLSVVLYQHIMHPLKQLDAATRAFSKGNFDVRVKEQLGTRDDELAQLSETFDRMADHIGDLILRQRQLITDLSHELRTPLTRLDIATENLISGAKTDSAALEHKLARVHRESRHIRRLVDDTLTLSWLDNETPDLRNESLDLVDLLQVVIDDAEFEYPDRAIQAELPEHAMIDNSNHRALGQAIENVLRNALRYTPPGGRVIVRLCLVDSGYRIQITDEGPGVPDKHLQAIFRPFFRVEASRPADTDGFGLGLALAQRQLSSVSAEISAQNAGSGGLVMSIFIPQS